jgi:hypothetical protein
MNAKRASIRIAHLFPILLMAASVYAAPPELNGASTFSGEIIDSLCAKNGSHDKMMQDMKSMGPDKNSCSAQCIKVGAKYVLFDSAKQATYQLNDQDKAAEFAGHKVHVSGTLEKMKIKVASITRAD